MEPRPTSHLTMRPRAVRLPRGVVGVLVALALVGCGSDEAPTAVSSSAVSSADSIASATTTTPPSEPEAPTEPTVDTTAETTTTSSAPTTTAVPTTTAAPTTTTAPPLTAADLVLAPLAVGPLTFGTGAALVVDALAPALGAPTGDRTYELPEYDPDAGIYTNTDEESVFTFPFARSVCFDNGLCVWFGGPTASDLQLVGYDYAGDPPIAPVLVTSLGLPLGARWADHPAAMTASPGGCYSIGSGESGGVVLVLLSTGVPFGSFEGESYVEQLPDPSTVTVIGMFAGDQVGYFYDDC